MHIHSRSIVYFDMIRRCGSIREAARRLHVSSSAVNRQLLQLEGELNAALFDRLPTGLQLTVAGEAFSRHVLTVLQDQNRLLSELELLRGVHRGAIAIAAVEGLNADILPAVLAQMRQRYPGITLRVLTCGSDEVVRALIAGDADVGIGFAIQRHDHIRQCAVRHFGLGAVVPGGHPLAPSQRVSFADCAQYPLILPTQALSIWALLQPAIQHYKGRMHVCMEVSSVELGKRLASQGVGIFFQSRIGIETEIAEGALAHIPLDAPQATFSELGVYVRAGRSLPPAVDAFLQITLRAIETYPPVAGSSTL
ncbi:LysR family transcriptional regulator [Lampropedia puyangensis]|uniref:LysR family transcriptional regulator n=1 Tax=Lampropedia puyangensis TaxID=1330072 RepID=A0A4S8ETM3_9BURK|nr:LysR family transcriptional regulator [Lampropedia puyangensis]THT98249.1 LysR family transcriptional regulator [Lampropedia puyangensis]